MTTMMTSSQFGLADMEALFWPSSPTADVMDSPSIHPDDDVQREGGECSLRGHAFPASPLASLSPSLSSSPPPFYSPPPSPPSVLHGDKARTESDLLPLSWLDHPGLLRCSQTPSGDGNSCNYRFFSNTNDNLCRLYWVKYLLSHFLLFIFSSVFRGCAW